jgi:histidine triad (HIT) family protein
MNECVFCRIARGETSARLVHDDGEIVAFHDANPQAPVHILVIPRRHIASLRHAGEGDRELLGRLLLVAAELARESGIAEEGFRVVTNTGRRAGQSVPHVHFHVLGGRAMQWPPG